MRTSEQNLSNIYDYILNVYQTQGRFLPIEIMYGDGTRFNKDKKSFEMVYNTLKNIIDNINK